MNRENKRERHGFLMPEVSMGEEGVLLLDQLGELEHILQLL